MKHRMPGMGRKFPRVLGVIAVIAFALSVFLHPAGAVPGQSPRAVESANQLPDWMTFETAIRLAIGIDVLVPSYVPAPFSGEPEVQASDGYYSLYWLIPGAPPTYLRITGTAGGEIPAFSYYDRNVQLEQNDSVMGHPAWHDVTPIYDLVYWQVGDVVYTVESHNMTGDTTMGIANSLSSLIIPETGGEVAEEEPADGATPAVEPSDGISISAIGVPSTVASSEIASIGLDGSGEVYLVASDGYFLATGDTGIAMATGTTVDWQAPATDGDLTVTFGAYRMSDDKLLSEATTTVHGVAAQAAANTVTDLQCPATASASMEARVALSGSGGVSVTSSSGYWPIETPNTDFQPYMDGGSTISGGLGSGATIALIWMAPEEVGTATMSVYDSTGNEIDSCSIEVVGKSGSGDLGAPAPSETGQAHGDGTGISEANNEVVSQVIANPIGFAGDASGGPEANGPDYGLVDEQASEDDEDDAVAVEVRTPVSTSAQSLSESPDSKLGPASGADGMYAITLGTQGGTLRSPFGATVIVPEDCLADQTTVMIKPVDDKVIPQVAGIAAVPGTAFDVAFSAADGQAGSLQSPALLTIALQSASMSENARIYRVEGSSLKLMPVTDSDAGSISTEIDGLARFVVGVPQNNAAASTSSISPFLIGGLGLVALASAGLLISRGLARRKPKLIPTRRPSNSRVRYR